MEYTVISQHGIEELIEEVNKQINNGWNPIGAAAIDDLDGCYIQTMVKQENNISINNTVAKDMLECLSYNSDIDWKEEFSKNVGKISRLLKEINKKH